MALRLAGIVVVPLIWLVLSGLHLVSARALPSPFSVYASLAAQSDTLALNFALTVERAFLGYSVGCAAGITAVLVMGWSVALRGFTEPVVLMLRPVPPLALAPFAILWFGLGLAGVVALSSWGVFFVLIVVGLEALRSVPIIYVRAAQALGAGPGIVYRRIVLPALLPGLMGGFRVALVVAFNLTILQEFTIASGGLGEVIMRGYRYLHPPQLIGGVLCVILTVLVLDLAFVAVRARLLAWVE